MPFQYTFRGSDISSWESAARDLVENRDRELELYSTTIDTSFLNLNASNLTSGTVPSARMTGAYTGITGLGTLGSLNVSGVSSFGSEILATTSIGAGRGVGIKADPADAQSILQFTNNAISAQWSSIVATNGLLTATTSVAVSGNVTVPNNSNSYFANENGANFWRPTTLSGNSYFRISSGSFYVDAANYYFRNASSANIMTLASSGATTINGTLTVNAAVYSNGWFRSTGTTGWYSETYGGGIYMDNVNEVKVYNGKAFSVPSSISSGNQITCASNLNVGGAIILSGPGIAYYGSTVGGGSPNQIGFRWASPYVNCTVDNVISAIAANFSDRRLKTNIQTLTNGIDLVRGLRCVKYNPLDVIGFDEETFEPIIGDLDPYDEMIGFIADEVQEVYANAIHGEGNRMKSIDTVQLLSIAVSAIQDLDQRLQQLETV